MRLLFVIDHFGSGGAQRQLTNLACGLVARGHNVEFFVYHPTYRFFRSQVDAAGIRVHEAAESNRAGIRVVLEIRALLRTGRYDAALAFLDVPNLYLSLASIGVESVPVVTSERVDPLVGGRGLRHALAMYGHRFADRVVANSESAVAELVRSHKWLESKLVVIRNGVDLTAFHRRPIAQQSPSGRLRLLSAGTITPRKNAHTLIEAMLELRRRGYALPMVTWVGKADVGGSHTEYQQALQRTLERNGIAESWVWAGERADMVALMHDADALVHPSHREGLANVVCEALACGLPVLVSDRGENRWLGGGSRGMLFDPESPSEIADVIARFTVLSRMERDAMSDAAYSFAHRELSLEKYVSLYERLFQELY